MTLYVAVIVDEEGMIEKVWPKAFKVWAKAASARVSFERIIARHDWYEGYTAKVLKYDGKLTANKQEGTALRSLRGKNFCEVLDK